MKGLLKSEQSKTTAEDVCCNKSLNKTEDKAKLRAQQFGGVTEGRVSNAATRIKVVRNPASELHDSVAKATNRQRCCQARRQEVRQILCTQVWHCCVEVKAQLRVCACVNIGVETATGACTHKYSDPDGFNYSLVARGGNETACTAHELPTIADVVDGQDGVGRQQSTRFVTLDGHWAEQEHMTMRAKGQCCKHTCTRTACFTRQHGLVRHCPWLKFWMHFHVILSQMNYMRQPLHNLSASWKTIGFFRCLRPIITDLSEYPKMSNLERNDFVIF